MEQEIWHRFLFLAMGDTSGTLFVVGHSLSIAPGVELGTQSTAARAPFLYGVCLFFYFFLLGVVGCRLSWRFCGLGFLGVGSDATRVLREVLTKFANFAKSCRDCVVRASDRLCKVLLLCTKFPPPGYICVLKVCMALGQWGMVLCHAPCQLSGDFPNWGLYAAAGVLRLVVKCIGYCMLHYRGVSRAGG